MIDVTFHRWGADDHHSQVQAVPRIGEQVILDAAPQGAIDRVTDVRHRIGGGVHRINIYLISERDWQRIRR